MNNARLQDHKDGVGYADAMHAALASLYAPLKGAAKILAQVCDAHPNTTANWLRKRNAPSGEQLVALMAADPAIEDVIARLVRERRRNAEVLRLKVRASNEALRQSLSAAAVPGVRDNWDVVPSRSGPAFDRRSQLMAEVMLRSVS